MRLLGPQLQSLLIRSLQSLLGSYLAVPPGPGAWRCLTIAARLVPAFFFLASSLALSHDWEEDEGVFVNASDRPAWCFWDEPARTCFAELAPGKGCLADAVSITPVSFPLPAQRVFKIPNRSLFFCARPTPLNGPDGDLRCLPANLYSLARFHAASAKNGAEKYGRMTLASFFVLMGRAPFTLCPLRER